MTKKLVYQTGDGRVIYQTTAHPDKMPWVGQRALIPSKDGPLVVEQVHGDRSGYTAVVGAL